MKKVLSFIVLFLYLAAPAWPQDDQAKGRLAERLDNLSQALDITLGALDGVIDAALKEATVKAGEAADKALEATVDALGQASEALIQARDDLKKAQTPVEFEAVVQSVTDGDTIVVRTTEAEEIKIRLYGLDAPESDQEGGEAAAKALRPLQGRQVTVKEMDDSRTMALVEHEGRSVNLEQVKQGQAWFYPPYCQEQPICGEMEKAEAEAREAGRGLWAKGWFWERKGEPVPPWEWREKK
jgi:endonuclease YncB( thermonuclease family)